MNQSSHFVIVSHEPSCCPSTKRVEEALHQFGVVVPQRVEWGTIEASLLQGAADTALFLGQGTSLPFLFVIDDGDGKLLWAGGNPSEEEISQAVYLAGNFA